MMDAGLPKYSCSHDYYNQDETLVACENDIVLCATRIVLTFRTVVGGARSPHLRIHTGTT